MRYHSILQIIALCSTASLAQAENSNSAMICSGAAPDWSLDLGTDTASFSFQRDSDLSVQLVTTPRTLDWPRAITMIGRGDSAILIVEPAICETGNMSARVLTQRGETPILLIGCCQVDMD